MLEKRCVDYFGQDHNCSMSTFHGGCDEWGVSPCDQTMCIMRGYGGGFGCGNVCGALTGAIAALAAYYIRDPQQRSEAFSQAAAGVVADFKQAFGSEMCADIAPRYKSQGRRCDEVVALTARLMEKYKK